MLSLLLQGKSEDEIKIFPQMMTIKAIMAELEGKTVPDEARSFPATSRRKMFENELAGAKGFELGNKEFNKAKRQSSQRRYTQVTRL